MCMNTVTPHFHADEQSWFQSAGGSCIYIHASVKSFQCNMCVHSGAFSGAW